MSNVTAEQLRLFKDYKESNVTGEQWEAITNAWLDLSAVSEMLNGDGPIEPSAWIEIAEAAEDSVKELEEAFPDLLEGIKE